MGRFSPTPKFMKVNYPDWEWTVAVITESTARMSFFRDLGAKGGACGEVMLGTRRYIKRSNKRAIICSDWNLGVFGAGKILTNDGTSFNILGYERADFDQAMALAQAWFDNRREEIRNALNEADRLVLLEAAISERRLTGIDAVRARFVREDSNES